MRKNSFSEEITKLATVRQCQDRYKMSRYLIMKYSKEAGALIKVGTDNRVVRIDVPKFDKWLEKASV